MLPVVALVGRPNVGKSTLFNALTRSRDALVADHPGLTRDRRYGTVDNEDGRFVLVDTGGLASGATGIQILTAEQAQAAIDESSLLLFMVDARDGLTEEDRLLAERLRTVGKPIRLVVNKTDGLDEQVASAEFHELGLGDPIAVAAAHRRGLKGLLAGIRRELPEHSETPPEPAGEVTRIAIIGRPNVGKSTLVNRLLGEERVVAYDEPGTTRDTVQIGWEHAGRRYLLMDTAGVRRRARVSEAVEKFSIIKALQAIEVSDVVVVVMDARDGVVDQDATLLGHVLDSGRALVIAVNKWDGLDREQRDEVRRGMDRKLRFVTYAEAVMISARHGSGLGELIDAVGRARASAYVDVSSRRLTDILEAARERHSPPMVRGRTARLRYAHLGGHNPLRIVVHGSRTETVPESYRRYLANAFRAELELYGTPLRLDLRDGENPFKDRRNTLTRRQVEKRRRLKKFVKRKGRR